jgi:hypothetical protein
MIYLLDTLVMYYISANISMMLSAYTIEETRQIWEKGSAWTGTDDEFAASAEEYLWGMIKSRVNRGFMTQDAAKHWTEKLYRSCFLPTFHSWVSGDWQKKVKEEEVCSEILCIISKYLHMFPLNPWIYYITT